LNHRLAARGKGTPKKDNDAEKPGTQSIFKDRVYNIIYHAPAYNDRNIKV